jgi:hypothetical protein
LPYADRVKVRTLLAIVAVTTAPMAFAQDTDAPNLADFPAWATPTAVIRCFCQNSRQLALEVNMIHDRHPRPV